MLQKVRKILEGPENRETFFVRIAEVFPTLDPRYKLIEQAYNDAKEAFRGKFRESGERYFEHLRAVTLMLIEYLRITDHDVIIAAILHDIVEDVPSWPLDRVQKTYGDKVAHLVEYLSKPGDIKDKNRRNYIYHKRFEQAPRTFFYIKLADRLHNLLTMWDCEEEKRQRKINETRLYYLQHAEIHWILLHELEAILEELEAGRD